MRHLALVATLALAAPAYAADHDSQAWTALFVTAPLSSRVDATMEVHTRFTDEVSRLGQLLLRPSVTLKLEDGFSVSGGYAYVRTSFANAASNEEHRLWQQLGYRFLERDGVRLTGRTRLEQRQRANAASDIGWRLRQQLRFQAPIATGKTSALVWNETFVQLNDTRWGARAGIDQVRTFVGAAVPLGTKVSLEPGYLNQTIFRIGRDRVNHIVSATLITRL